MTTLLLKPIPGPRETAARQARAIKADPEHILETPLQRVLAGAPWLDRQTLIDGTVRFHAERMERVPDRSKFPEAAPWVEFVRDTDRHLREMTGISAEQLAVRRSLRAFVAWRAGNPVAAARPSGDEKCRALFLPDSDHGALLVKNLDDPSAHWKPRPPIDALPDDAPGMAGVGSGLHFDDEPEEIFPLAPREMVRHYCVDVPATVEFLRRYAPFWGSANLLLFDAEKRSATIEKCSFRFFEVFEPDSCGRSIVSGMTCRDPESPQARHQSAMRRRALEASGRSPEDSPDTAFWRAARKMHEKLRDTVAAWGSTVRLDDVIALFTTPYPEGLNKENARFHPEQPVDAWTLSTTITFLDEKRVLRWQRAQGTMRWPDHPEEYRFA